MNPADDASRGLTAQNLGDSSRWWNGPNFLWKPLEDRPCPDGSEAIYFPPGDPEVKRITAMTTQTLEPFSLPKRIGYFSCWHRAKRAVAVCLRLQKKIQRIRIQPNMKTYALTLPRRNLRWRQRSTSNQEQMNTSLLTLKSSKIQNGKL